MKEIWKEIEGYEGMYQVSNTGKVKSFKKWRNKIDINGHLLHINYQQHSGYGALILYNKDGPKQHLIHRLVAQAFIPNPNNYKEINHKDEDKTNNQVDNLEWCNRAYNMAYGTAILRAGITRGRPVEQLTIDGMPIARYATASIAAKINNTDSSSILKCCNGRLKSVGRYKWRFSDYDYFSPSSGSPQ